MTNLSGLAQHKAAIPGPSTSFIISDTVLEVLDTTQFFVLMPILLMWGLSVGGVNIVAFIKMGLREGINQNFFILSVTDLLFAITQSTSYCINFMMFMGYRFSFGQTVISLMLLDLFFRFGSTIIKTYSTIVSTVIATVRCCFVTFPLHAPLVVTGRRQLVVIFSLCGASSVFYVTMYSYKSLTYATDSLTNKTVLILLDDPDHIHGYRNKFRIVTFFLFVSIILIALVILANSLKNGSKFRESVQGGAQISKKNAARKEVQVIKCVVFVAVVFIICNSPFLLYSFLRYFAVEDFMRGQKFHNEVKALGLVMRVFAQLNIGCNFFGYYNFNSRFKTTVNNMFCKSSKPNEDRKDE